MPRQTEPNANNALGSLLQAKLPRSQVWSENTQAIAGHPSLRPDIIVNAPGRSPVVVETEYLPARTVEPKAKSRLGLKVGANGRIIEAAIALRYPDTVSVKGGVILGHGAERKCPPATGVVRIP